ncbi:MAG: hypothetical protein HQ521_18090, partial [Bacteroidetes bacterium]|nr:hypothetical protein [Bacteroidota bacterium]
MKKFTVLLLLIAITISVNAQESSAKVSSNAPQWKSYFSFGSAILTRQGFRDFGDTFWREEFKNLYSDNELYVKNVSSSRYIPLLELRYKYFINANIVAGLRVSYVSYKHDGDLNFDNGNDFKASWNVNYFTGMADFNFYYLNREVIKLYAGLSAGVSQYNLKYTDVSDSQYNSLLDKTDNRLYFA